MVDNETKVIFYDTLFISMCAIFSLYIMNTLFGFIDLSSLYILIYSYIVVYILFSLFMIYYALKKKEYGYAIVMFILNFLGIVPAIYYFRLYRKQIKNGDFDKESNWKKKMNKLHKIGGLDKD